MKKKEFQMIGMVKASSIALLTFAVGTAATTSRVEAQTFYQPTTTYYFPANHRPIVAQPQVKYIPQATNRTVWRQVPVTTYRQVITVDPWTGRQIVHMQPVTTMQWQSSVQMVTTYRPIYVDPRSTLPELQRQEVKSDAVAPSVPENFLRDANREIKKANLEISELRGEVNMLSGEVNMLRKFVVGIHTP